MTNRIDINYEAHTLNTNASNFRCCLQCLNSHKWDTINESLCMYMYDVCVCAKVNDTNVHLYISMCTQLRKTKLNRLIQCKINSFFFLVKFNGKFNHFMFHYMWWGWRKKKIPQIDKRILFRPTVLKSCAECSAFAKSECHS